MNEITPQESQPEEKEEFIYQKPKPAISPIAAGFIGLFGGFVLYQIFGSLLTLLVLGFDIENQPINGVRIMTMVGQILFLFAPAIILAKLIYPDFGSVLRLNLPNWLEVLLFTIGIIVITPLLQVYMYIQNYFIDILASKSNLINEIKNYLDSFNELVEKTYSNLLKADTAFEGILIVFVIAITPAICEEFLFRGFIQKSFELKIKPFFAALITAVFFGIFHFNPYQLLPLIALGLYFGFTAYMSNSIFIPVFLHFLNNFSAVIIYFIYGDDELISSKVNSGADILSAAFYFIFLSAIFVGILFIIRNFYNKRKFLVKNDL